MEYIYYEIIFIVLLVLSFIFYKVKRNVDQQMSNILFARVLNSTILLCCLEFLMLLLHSQEPTPVRLFIFTSLLVANYINWAYLSFSWCNFLLLENDFFKGKLFRRPTHIIMTIPAFVLMVMSFVSPWTGWIFRVDGKSCSFEAGSLAIVQIIITYSYFTFASLATLVFLLKDSSHKNIFTRLSFVLVPFIGGVAHLLFPMLPAVWPGLAILLVMKYIDFQEDQIFIDGLTGLNNRKSFDKYLATLFNDKETKKIVLFMIDVDHFKMINDTYGHIEGDAALVKTAQVLRQVCNGKNAFLSRFGGDEFAIIYEETGRNDVEEFRNSIIKAFTSYNEKNCSQNHYSIRISLGYSCAFKKSSIKTPMQLIRNADRAMYKNKHAGVIKA